MIARHVAIACVALGVMAVSGCGYTWGIEHAPLLSGPGPHSGWVRVASTGAPYDVDLHLPPQRFLSGASVPLVIVLHGSGGTGPGMERRTRFSELADSVGFAVAYPDARKNAQGRRLWVGTDSASPDISMLRALIDSVATRVSLDRTRVYLTGFSNGGGMTYRAAQAMPSVFAAIGVVAGALGGMGSSPMRRDTRPIPLIAVHGMLDSTVRFDGEGRGSSAPSSVRNWAERNGCALSPSTETLSNGEFIRTMYDACPMGANAVLYAMVRGGHGWPNVHTNEAPFATTITIWNFLKQYSRH